MNKSCHKGADAEQQLRTVSRALMLWEGHREVLGEASLHQVTGAGGLLPNEGTWLKTPSDYIKVLKMEKVVHDGASERERWAKPTVLITVDCSVQLSWRCC